VVQNLLKTGGGALAVLEKRSKKTLRLVEANFPRAPSLLLLTWRKNFGKRPCLRNDTGKSLVKETWWVADQNEVGLT